MYKPGGYSFTPWSRDPGERVPYSLADDRELMELVSEGLTWAQVGERMGRTARGVQERFTVLRRKMGWQAK